MPFDDSLLPAEPARPVASMVGGKRGLARRVIERLGVIPHEAYVEPFVGLGGVFLRRPFRAKYEVVNDASRDISNLFRIVQRHHAALIDLMRWQVASRAEFERLLATPPETLTDLERAARFVYVQRLAYGGRVVERHFAARPTDAGRFHALRLAAVIEAAHRRLGWVTIECLSWQACLARYDRPGTLFYLDPPYWGWEGAYGEGLFTRADFAELSDRLGKLKGRWLLSLNDRPELRDLFGRFALEEVRVKYGVQGATVARGEERQLFRELLISPR